MKHSPESYACATQLLSKLICNTRVKTDRHEYIDEYIDIYATYNMQEYMS